MKFVLLGALNGLIATAIYLLVPINSVYFQSFIAMLVSALIAELLARIMKAPATVFIVIGCFPLVPGRGIYQTMLYAVRSDSTMFIQSFLRTFGTAMSLALAILVSSTIILVYRKLKTQPDLLFKDPYE
jgi:uncharacterized membrane protein YjjB (DUF3815 family)